VQPRVVVLASGSGTLLQALLDSDVGSAIVAVGSDVPAAPALGRARSAGIQTFICDPSAFPDRNAWNLALLNELRAIEPDLVVSAGFMRILGPSVVAAFRIINTHPSLLPAFPGAHAVRDTLAAGATESGCTVHWVDDGVDTGPIIAQVRVPIESGDDETSLHERIKVVERDLLIRTVRTLLEQVRQDG
jgi:phosphoribosylglycinamide formyltransferase-1